MLYRSHRTDHGSDLGTINNSPWERISVIKQLSEVQLTSLLIQ